MINRKKFLEISTMGITGLFVSPSLAASKQTDSEKFEIKQQPIKFGIITDLHYDLMHDSDRRAQLFIDAMNKEQPDFIISLGDFCMPKPSNKNLIEIWKKFNGKKHYLLGNHDTDGGFTKEQALAFWGAEKPYYSFDDQGFHFVILDGNEKDPQKKLSGYPRTIGKEQLKWLKEDLINTKLRTIIFCHQGLENTINGLDNGMEVRYLFEQINKEAGYNKVILVLTGHHHLNYHNQINDIHYVQINSASYYWAGEDFESKAFGEEFYKKHCILKRTLVYKDPIWAMVSLDKKHIKIEGTETVMAGISLEQSGINVYKDVYPISSKIDSRKLTY
ncbi:metallophosphoesterase [Sphingobacterium sp. 40-24]|uniref:metallophosphoesterase family protein n=1 Tax=Sphingobacterium sp. 40-24 TaxID=1895843 RepID=UPI00095B042F|nr:metallophosphoesterase [Sphingobacterium sp. 40-24]OJZ00084.1 MAG: alkaline phosphatase [Sphingobacterium sp. 40-24]